MKFCLIGEKLGHSYSAEIHAMRGLDYSLCEVEKKDLSAFVKNSPYKGFNVTIPYKKAVTEYLDGLSERAKALGAVNTVDRCGGRLSGDNTDLGGLLYTFCRSKIDPSGGAAVVLGTGGAAQAAVFALKTLGAEKIYSVSRSGEINYGNYAERCADAKVLINATPVGMYPNIGQSPVNLKELPDIKGIIDLVYNPCRTALTAQAEELGIRAVNGLIMLAEQALLSEDIWLSRTHGAGEAEDIARALMRGKLNLVLTGMPSCGKTALGRLAARILNRKFFDADECFTEKFGAAPAAVISGKGEKVFRDMESIVIKELSLNSGAVIATGGGAVLRKENTENLKANGVIVYVKRDLEALSVSGRPLSERNGIEKLYRERKEIYERTADAFVLNAGSLENTAKEIVKEYETACDKRA